MNNEIDTLYEYFEHHLFSADIEDETEERFVIRVIEKYVTSLLRQGFILSDHSDEIRDDLQEEVYGMLKAKTYGYFSIGDFRRAMRQKTN
ncbi:MAG: hypothetical protein KDD61_11405 [Bdellovibrionales bacterium]|nr:hypothetical protein [Bdellovibrionales bacterium]